MPTEPAKKSDPARESPLLFEEEWRDELDRRRELPDGEWIEGGIGDQVLADYLAEKRMKSRKK